MCFLSAILNKKLFMFFCWFRESAGNEHISNCFTCRMKNDRTAVSIHKRHRKLNFPSKRVRQLGQAAAFSSSIRRFTPSYMLRTAVNSLMPSRALFEMSNTPPSDSLCSPWMPAGLSGANLPWQKKTRRTADLQLHVAAQLLEVGPRRHLRDLGHFFAWQIEIYPAFAKYWFDVNQSLQIAGVQLIQHWSSHSHAELIHVHEFLAENCHFVARIILDSNA